MSSENTHEPASPDVPATWGELRSRRVQWHDPELLADAARSLPGLDFLQRIVDGRLPPPPIAAVFGTRLVSVAPGQAVFACTPEESAYNPIGMVHGGWTCTLLDSAAGCALHTLLPAGAGYSSIEIKVSFMRPIHGGPEPIEFHGRVLREGRRVAFAEAYARTREGEVLAHGTSSLMVLR